MSGEAFTFVSADEQPDLHAIERVLGRSLPRVTLPDFDYTARAAHLEVPLKDRIAAIRQRKGEERERAKINAARRAAGARGLKGQQTSAGGESVPRTRPDGPRGRGGASSGRFRPRGPRRPQS
jgi:ATP-dependent RNA helicase RhlE